MRSRHSDRPPALRVEDGRSIREALLAHPDGPIFTSLPRAGTIRAATLPAEIGNCRDRFPDDTALAAAGVAPSTRQSGHHLNITHPPTRL